MLTNEERLEAILFNIANIYQRRGGYVSSLYEFLLTELCQAKDKN